MRAAPKEMQQKNIKNRVISEIFPEVEDGKGQKGKRLHIS